MPVRSDAGASETTKRIYDPVLLELAWGDKDVPASSSFRAEAWTNLPSSFNSSREWHAIPLVTPEGPLHASLVASAVVFPVAVGGFEATFRWGDLPSEGDQGGGCCFISPGGSGGPPSAAGQQGGAPQRGACCSKHTPVVTNPLAASPQPPSQQLLRINTNTRGGPGGASARDQQQQQQDRACERWVRCSSSEPAGGWRWTGTPGQNATLSIQPPSAALHRLMPQLPAAPVLAALAANFSAAARALTQTPVPVFNQLLDPSVPLPASLLQPPAPGAPPAAPPPGGAARSIELLPPGVAVEVAYVASLLHMCVANCSTGAPGAGGPGGEGEAGPVSSQDALAGRMCDGAPSAALLDLLTSLPLLRSSTARTRVLARLLGYDTASAAGLLTELRAAPLSAVTGALTEAQVAAAREALRAQAAALAAAAEEAAAAAKEAAAAAAAARAAAARGGSPSSSSSPSLRGPAAAGGASPLLTPSPGRSASDWEIPGSGGSSGAPRPASRGGASGVGSRSQRRGPEGSGSRGSRPKGQFTQLMHSLGGTSPPSGALEAGGASEEYRGRGAGASPVLAAVVQRLGQLDAHTLGLRRGGGGCSVRSGDTPLYSVSSVGSSDGSTCGGGGTSQGDSESGSDAGSSEGGRGRGAGGGRAAAAEAAAARLMTSLSVFAGHQTAGGGGLDGGAADEGDDWGLLGPRGSSPTGGDGDSKAARNTAAAAAAAAAAAEESRRREEAEGRRAQRRARRDARALARLAVLEAGGREARERGRAVVSAAPPAVAAAPPASWADMEDGFGGAAGATAGGKTLPVTGGGPADTDAASDHTAASAGHPSDPALPSGSPAAAAAPGALGLIAPRSRSRSASARHTARPTSAASLSPHQAALLRLGRWACGAHFDAGEPLQSHALDLFVNALQHVSPEFVHAAVIAHVLQTLCTSPTGSVVRVYYARALRTMFARGSPTNSVTLLRPSDRRAVPNLAKAVIIAVHDIVHAHLSDMATAQGRSRAGELPPMSPVHSGLTMLPGQAGGAPQSQLSTPQAPELRHTGLVAAGKAGAARGGGGADDLSFASDSGPFMRRAVAGTELTSSGGGPGAGAGGESAAGAAAGALVPRQRAVETGMIGGPRGQLPPLQLSASAPSAPSGSPAPSSSSSSSSALSPSPSARVQHPQQMETPRTAPGGSARWVLPRGAGAASSAPHSGSPGEDEAARRDAAVARRVLETSSTESGFDLQVLMGFIGDLLHEGHHSHAPSAQVPAAGKADSKAPAPAPGSPTSTASGGSSTTAGGERGREEGREGGRDAEGRRVSRRRHRSGSSGGSGSSGEEPVAAVASGSSPSSTPGDAAPGAEEPRRRSSRSRRSREGGGEGSGGDSSSGRGDSDPGAGGSADDEERAAGKSRHRHHHRHRHSSDSPSPASPSPSPHSPGEDEGGGPGSRGSSPAPGAGAPEVRLPNIRSPGGEPVPGGEEEADPAGRSLLGLEFEPPSPGAEARGDAVSCSELSCASCGGDCAIRASTLTSATDTSRVPGGAPMSDLLAPTPEGGPEGGQPPFVEGASGGDGPGTGAATAPSPGGVLGVVLPPKLPSRPHEIALGPSFSLPGRPGSTPVPGSSPTPFDDVEAVPAAVVAAQSAQAGAAAAAAGDADGHGALLGYDATAAVGVGAGGGRAAPGSAAGTAPPSSASASTTGGGVTSAALRAAAAAPAGSHLADLCPSSDRGGSSLGLWMEAARAVAHAAVKLSSVPDGGDGVTPEYKSVLACSLQLCSSCPLLREIVLRRILRRWPSGNSDNEIALLEFLATVLATTTHRADLVVTDLRSLMLSRILRSLRSTHIKVARNALVLAEPSRHLIDFLVDEEGGSRRLGEALRANAEQHWSPLVRRASAACLEGYSRAFAAIAARGARRAALAAAAAAAATPPRGAAAVATPGATVGVGRAAGQAPPPEARGGVARALPYTASPAARTPSSGAATAAAGAGADAAANAKLPPQLVGEVATAPPVPILAVPPAEQWTLGAEAVPIVAPVPAPPAGAVAPGVHGSPTARGPAPGPAAPAPLSILAPRSPPTPAASAFSPTARSSPNPRVSPVGGAHSGGASSSSSSAAASLSPRSQPSAASGSSSRAGSRATLQLQYSDAPLVRVSPPQLQVLPPAGAEPWGSIDAELTLGGPGDGAGPLPVVASSRSGRRAGLRGEGQGRTVPGGSPSPSVASLSTALPPLSTALSVSESSVESRAGSEGQHDGPGAGGSSRSWAGRHPPATGAPFSRPVTAGTAISHLSDASTGGYSTHSGRTLPGLADPGVAEAGAEPVPQPAAVLEAPPAPQPLPPAPPSRTPADVAPLRLRHRSHASAPPELCGTLLSGRGSGGGGGSTDSSAGDAPPAVADASTAPRSANGPHSRGQFHLGGRDLGGPSPRAAAAAAAAGAVVSSSSAAAAAEARPGGSGAPTSAPSAPPFAAPFSTAAEAPYRRGGEADPFPRGATAPVGTAQAVPSRYSSSSSTGDETGGAYPSPSGDYVPSPYDGSGTSSTETMAYRYGGPGEGGDSSGGSGANSSGTSSAGMYVNTPDSAGRTPAPARDGSGKGALAALDPQAQLSGAPGHGGGLARRATQVEQLGLPPSSSAHGALVLGAVVGGGGAPAATAAAVHHVAVAAPPAAAGTQGPGSELSAPFGSGAPARAPPAGASGSSSDAPPPPLSACPSASALLHRHHPAQGSGPSSDEPNGPLSSPFVFHVRSPSTDAALIAYRRRRSSGQLQGMPSAGAAEGAAGGASASAAAPSPLGGPAAPPPAAASVAAAAATSQELAMQAAMPAFAPTAAAAGSLLSPSTWGSPGGTGTPGEGQAPSGSPAPVVVGSRGGRLELRGKLSRALNSNGSAAGGAGSGAGTGGGSKLRRSLSVRSDGSAGSRGSDGGRSSGADTGDSSINECFFGGAVGPGAGGPVPRDSIMFPAPPAAAAAAVASTPASASGSAAPSAAEGSSGGSGGKAT